MRVRVRVRDDGEELGIRKDGEKSVQCVRV